MSSKRKYHVYSCAAYDTEVMFSVIPIEWVLEKTNITDGEHLCSMKELVDDILDLSIGESLYFHPYRGDEQSKGIILRVS